jgi:hypothetical protein
MNHSWLVNTAVRRVFLAMLVLVGGSRGVDHVRSAEPVAPAPLELKAVLDGERVRVTFTNRSDGAVKIWDPRRYWGKRLFVLAARIDSSRQVATIEPFPHFGSTFGVDHVDIAPGKSLEFDLETNKFRVNYAMLEQGAIAVTLRWQGSFQRAGQDEWEKLTLEAAPWASKPPHRWLIRERK